jgi:N-acetyl-anhydromuramyl-L-alanine amidase AmpD
MTIIPASWKPKADMKRIIVHWTAGSHKANAVDRKAYHILIEGDGHLVRGDFGIDANVLTKRGHYAAHTLNCNTGSIGVSLCCMGGAKESPFDPGKWPMTKTQWDKLCVVVAELARAYSIPVTPRSVLSHAEVQGTLGIKQKNKWDYTRLAFDEDVKGAKACGDKLRHEVLIHWGAPKETEPQQSGSGGTLVTDTDMSAVEIQQRLNANGARLMVDGIIGPKTKQAIRMFQLKKGLVVDGIVGPRTRAALRGKNV